MKINFHKLKMKLLCKISNPQSVLFHIVGIACIIWFLVRVIPKPDRMRYPCQQLSITVASSYIIFWVILWSALFHGLGLWIKRAKHKTVAYAPVLLIGFILLFSISTNVFADVEDEDQKPTLWEPISNDPIGTPRGVNPGRVVWVWDPDATESNLKGFWWKKENNNQQVIDEMMSDGIKALAGVEDESEAWDILFTHFNEIHGYGLNSYQPGEKIAIKVNLNNNWGDIQYFAQSNERDASPNVVKGLLRKLVNVVGIAQDDIIVYDASRPIPNWFFNRVYYEEFPSLRLKAEFPDVHYVDYAAKLPGREKVEPSNVKIHFADGLVRTLPTCVVDAKYLINMPILKRHPIDYGVTLSGKNLFGTWIENIWDLHPFHRSGFTEGNPTPQTDLLSHEHIGGKTFLYLGDGLYPTKKDHYIIDKFEMYPFNNDWTNSLFFSQDPVAMDSVMYDFLHTEGTNPCEGSQNYLHQSAIPNANTYDPENDGVFLSESLGVHEHWNKSVDIFSPDRYSGVAGNGIDFVAIGTEHASPAVIITNPKENYFYVNGEETKFLLTIRKTVIIGKLNIEAKANIPNKEVEKIEFYVDNKLMSTDETEPYTWLWSGSPGIGHTLKVVAYYENQQTLSKELEVWKIF
jgi:hypothetical protein